MKGYKFLRNYGDYKKDQTYSNESVKIEEKELANLIQNKTIIIVEITEVVNELPKKLNQTILEKEFPEIYQKVFDKGVKSKDEEIVVLNKKVEELTAELEALKKGTE